LVLAVHNVHGGFDSRRTFQKTQNVTLGFFICPLFGLASTGMVLRCPWVIAP
jgi:hypothetical protein